MAAPQGLTPEFAAGFRQVMLDSLMRELDTTKKVLNAVPDAKSDYRPDPHARTAWELAWHIANTDVQFLDGIADLNFKMETPEQLVTPIEFFGVFNLPAVAYLGFLNNHSIHHRGELATYLRPMGSKVPSIYGGSYDEPFQPPASKTTAA